MRKPYSLQLYQVFVVSDPAICPRSLIAMAYDWSGGGTCSTSKPPASVCRKACEIWAGVEAPDSVTVPTATARLLMSSTDVHSTSGGPITVIVTFPWSPERVVATGSDSVAHPSMATDASKPRYDDLLRWHIAQFPLFVSTG